MRKIINIAYMISNFFSNYNGRTIRAYNICKFVNFYKDFKVIILTPYLANFASCKIPKIEKRDNLMIYRYRPFNFLKILKLFLKKKDRYHSFQVSTI